MKNIRITRKNNGAGLGDTMAQVNFIYRLARKLNAEYVHVPFVSVTHDQNYDNLLGLNKYPNIIRDSDKFEEVGLEEICKKYEYGKLDDDVLYAVQYDYNIANHIFNKFNLKNYDYFPWRNYFQYVHNNKEINYLLHLRFGDSFCYPLSHDYYFDARNKKIIKYEICEDNRYIWGIKEVENCLNYFKKNGQSVTIISDGIASVLRSLAWNDFGKGFPLTYINEAVNSNWIRVNKLVESYGFEIQCGDITSDVNKIIGAKKIVCTEGSFVRQINHFLKSSPVDIIDIKRFGEDNESIFEFK